MSPAGWNPISFASKALLPISEWQSEVVLYATKPPFRRVFTFWNFTPVIGCMVTNTCRGERSRGHVSIYGFLEWNKAASTDAPTFWIRLCSQIVDRCRLLWNPYLVPASFITKYQWFSEAMPLMYSLLATFVLGLSSSKIHEVDEFG